MTRKKKPAVSPRVSPAVSPEVSPEVSREEAAQGRIIERPDGFYWESKATEEPRGPFTTLAEAEADLLAGGAAGGELDPTETLQEAESEIGIAEWIDPDTGVPAEDSVPRIEDH
jgi:hypothetical protein